MKIKLFEILKSNLKTIPCQYQFVLMSLHNICLTKKHANEKKNYSVFLIYYVRKLNLYSYTIKHTLTFSKVLGCTKIDFY